jgi:hypothetical protein
VEVLDYRDRQPWRSRLEEKPAAFVAYLGARRWVVERTFLAEPGTPPEQGLRAAARDGRSHDLRGDEPSHASQADAGSMRALTRPNIPICGGQNPLISAGTKPAGDHEPASVRRTVRRASTK